MAGRMDRRVRGSMASQMELAPATKVARQRLKTLRNINQHGSPSHPAARWTLRPELQKMSFTSFLEGAGGSIDAHGRPRQLTNELIASQTRRMMRSKSTAGGGTGRGSIGSTADAQDSLDQSYYVSEAGQGLYQPLDVLRQRLREQQDPMSGAMPDITGDGRIVGKGGVPDGMTRSGQQGVGDAGGGGGVGGVGARHRPKRGKKARTLEPESLAQRALRDLGSDMTGSQSLANFREWNSVWQALGSTHRPMRTGTEPRRQSQKNPAKLSHSQTLPSLASSKSQGSMVFTPSARPMTGDGKTDKTDGAGGDTGPYQHCDAIDAMYEKLQKQSTQRTPRSAGVPLSPVSRPAAAQGSTQPLGASPSSTTEQMQLSQATGVSMVQHTPADEGRLTFEGIGTTASDLLKQGRWDILLSAAKQLPGTDAAVATLRLPLPVTVTYLTRNVPRARVDTFIRQQQQEIQTRQAERRKAGGAVDPADSQTYDSRRLVTVDVPRDLQPGSEEALLRELLDPATIIPPPPPPAADEGEGRARSSSQGGGSTGKAPVESKQSDADDSGSDDDGEVRGSDADHGSDAGSEKDTDPHQEALQQVTMEQRSTLLCLWELQLVEVGALDPQFQSDATVGYRIRARPLKKLRRRSFDLTPPDEKHGGAEPMDLGEQSAALEGLGGEEATHPAQERRVLLSDAAFMYACRQSMGTSGYIESPIMPLTDVKVRVGNREVCRV